MTKRLAGGIDDGGTIYVVNRFFHPDRSPTATLLTDVAEHLAGGGRQVTVLTSRRRWDDAAARLPLLELRGRLRVERFRAFTSGRGLISRVMQYVHFYVGCALRLLRAKRGDLVVIESDPPLLSVVVATVARIRGFRLIAWQQDVFPEVAAAYGLIGGGVLSMLIALRNWSLRRAAAIVVISEGMAGHLQREVGSARFLVLPNWVDCERLFPVRRLENELREKWGLEDSFVVMYSGHLGRVHDFRTALAAAELLIGDEDIRFLFVGDACMSVRRVAKSRGLHNVIFQSFQPAEQLSNCLSIGDVHWLSLEPQYENLVLPSKLYGILAVGRPAIMVGALQGEVARLLASAGCGVTVASGDGAGFAAAVRRLRDDGAHRAALGARARAICESRYSRTVALDAWSSLVAEVCT